MAAPLKQTYHLVVKEKYAPVPVYALSRTISQSHSFDNACFIFDTDLKTPNNLFLIDHFQFMFFSGMCAYRLQGWFTLQDVIGFITDVGKKPFLVTTSENKELDLAVKLEDNPYYVYALGD